MRKTDTETDKERETGGERVIDTDRQRKMRLIEGQTEMETYTENFPPRYSSFSAYLFPILHF